MASSSSDNPFFVKAETGTIDSNCRELGKSALLPISMRLLFFVSGF